MTDGQRIKDLREQRGITLEELGKKIGITRQAVHSLETRDNIGLATMRKVADALGTHPAYLMGFVSEEDALAMLDHERVLEAYKKASPETKAIIRKILEV